MRIFIRDLGGSRPQLELEVHLESTIDHIKQTIYEQWSIPPADQRLLYSGKVTGELTSLHTYGVHHGSSITLVDRNRNRNRESKKKQNDSFGASLSPHISSVESKDASELNRKKASNLISEASMLEVPIILRNERIIMVDIDRDGSVIELKGAIEEACELAGMDGFDMSSKRLRFGDTVLRSRDSVKLRDLGLTEDTLVRVETLYTRPYGILIVGQDLPATLNLEVIYSDSIGSVKDLIAKEIGIPAWRLSLSFVETLVDADILADCLIDSDCALRLEILPDLNAASSKRKEKIRVLVWYSGGAREIFTFAKSDTVLSVKQKISKERGVPETHIEIRNQDRLFDDDCALDDYNIREGRILKVGLAGIELIDVFLEGPDGNIIPSSICPSTTSIAELKAYACHWDSSVPQVPAEFDMTIEDRVLEENSTLEANHVSCTTKLTIRIKKDTVLNDMALYDLSEDLTYEEARKHLLRDKSGTLASVDWKTLLPLLPECLRGDLKYAQFCWTYISSGSLPNIEIPLTIAGAPVVIPVDYRYPLSAGVAPPQDPYSKIDPQAKIDTKTIERAFKTFPEAYGFYFLINGMLQVIVPKCFDYEWAYSHRPNTFGGLEVSYIRRSLVPTAGHRSARQQNVALSSNSGSGSSARHHPRVVSQRLSSNSSSTNANPKITLSSAIEARSNDPKGKSKSKEAHFGRIGVRTNVENGKNAGVYLVMSSHVITSSLLARSRGPFQKLFGSSRSPQLEDGWFEDADIWIQDRKIGTIYKTFDPRPEQYPGGFVHDVSLVRPSVRFMDGLRDVKSPIPNLGWATQQTWDCIRRETSQLRILDSYVDDDGPEVKTIKSTIPSDVNVVGEGIFLNQQKLSESRKHGEQRLRVAGQDHERQYWSTLVSHCILYRLSSDFQVPGGQSGIAIYTEGERSDKSFGPGVVGFQSFMQRSGHIQTYEMEGQALAARLEKGLVAFYGAFQVPKELRREHVIL